MSTQLTIPAYAQALVVAGNKTALTEAASGGVGGRAEFPHISIKQSRWRLVDVEGEELVLKSFAVQFAVIAINPTVSKSWYMNKYSPGDEPSAPDCYSDNGVVPMPDSDLIQSQQCATCDKNVWGSDVNPTNGKKLKACRDAKNVAWMFLNADNLQAEVPEIYAQRLSAMSMINFSNFAKEVANNGGALDYVVIGAEFDDQAEYPLIKYSVVRNMTEAEYLIVNSVRESVRATAAAKMDQKVIPILLEQVKNVPLRLAAPEGDSHAAGVEDLAAVQKEAERMQRVRAAQAAAAAQSTDKERMQARAAELAQQTQVIDPALVEKAKKLAAMKAQMAAMEAELNDPSAGADQGQGGTNPADATNVTKITDVEPKKPRNPVNVVDPAPASNEMEDLLAQALK